MEQTSGSDSCAAENTARPIETDAEQLDVTQIMRDIQARAQARKQQRGSPAFSLVEQPAGDLYRNHASTSELQASVSELRACRDSLDKEPPKPPTIRGSVGGTLQQF